jgi:hypothetical protein
MLSSRSFFSGIAAVATVLLLPGFIYAQPPVRPADTLGTLGAGIPQEATTPGRFTPPSGPAPRLASGKPDFSGVWDHPYVPDMSASNQRNPALQKGAGPLPYTAAGEQNIKAYDPEKNGDYTGMCMPFGFMRSINSPYPIQIMQNDKYVAFLFEQSTWFHVVPFRNEHSKEPNPTWFGESIARWNGDTLVVDTVGFNGYTRLDTRGNPHGSQLHLVQTFKHDDAGHVHYTVTIDDPVYYTRPWTNERTFTLANGDLLEYSCEENNRSLWEGRIKLWVPPNSEPLRNPKLGQP